MTTTPRRKREPEQPGPSEMKSPLVRAELQKALAWTFVVGGIALAVLLAQPIMLILLALVVCSMLDGGARLLGRILPIGRGWRLAIVVIGVFSFLVWVVYLTGSSLIAQAKLMQDLVESQVNGINDWARSAGIDFKAGNLQSIATQAMGSVGKVTAAVGTAVGVVTSAVMVLVLAIFIAIEPRLYERGFAWMLPMAQRANFYETVSKMAFALRRLMAGRLVGMAVEGVGTWFLLWVYGVPMAALLGVLTGIFAFLPNIGSIISGALIILVGFSGGTDQGLYAVGVYLAVQMVDGYLIVPMVAKRAVDLAPALVLGAQILFGALFGIVGLMLADPIVCMIKVYLEQRSIQAGAKAPRKGENSVPDTL